MRKRVFGRQLKRDINERKALFKGLASSLVIHERIQTTEAKAKAVKGYIEKLVTKAKKYEKTQAQRFLQAHLTHEALKKLIDEIAPRFVNRPGGYTRILKMGNRFSDNASMVILEWVVRPFASQSEKTVVLDKEANVGEKAKDVVLASKTETGKSAKATATKQPAKKKTIKKTIKKEITK